MKDKMHLFDFENLKVYQKSLDFVDQVYDLINALPSKETDNLASQFRRAACSISLNIGEGSAGSRKEFRHFLVISKRSLRECIVCITICSRRKYIDAETEENLRRQLIEISKMINGLIGYLESDKAINTLSEPQELYLRTPKNGPLTSDSELRTINSELSHG